MDKDNRYEPIVDLVKMNERWIGDPNEDEIEIKWYSFLLISSSPRFSLKSRGSQKNIKS